MGTGFRRTHFGIYKVSFKIFFFFFSFFAVQHKGAKVEVTASLLQRRSTYVCHLLSSTTDEQERHQEREMIRSSSRTKRVRLNRGEFDKARPTPTANTARESKVVTAHQLFFSPPRTNLSVRHTASGQNKIELICSFTTIAYGLNTLIVHMTALRETHIRKAFIF